MSQKSIRDFFLKDGFIGRANLLELALGVVAIISLEAVFSSFTKDILFPILYSTSGQPDLSFLRPFGIGIGQFANVLLTCFIQIAALYFLIVLPLSRLARKHPSNESDTSALR